VPSLYAEGGDLMAFEPFKRLGRMLFPRRAFQIFSVPRSNFDYQAEVGDGMGSSTVAAPVLWLARNFPEAPPALWEREDNNQNTQIWDHPMLRLLERPTPFHTGQLLWMATIADYTVNGEAFWIKQRSRAGTPVRLWYTPSWMMEPRPATDETATDDDAYVAFYVYSVDGQQYKLDPRDVVHFRFGLDPQNPRRGLSPLKSVLREVFTDDEAAAFTASLLRNMGIPGIMVSPDSDEEIDEGDARATKDYLMEKFSGDRRGEPIVMTSKTKIQQFGFSPEQLLLRELRRVPEERVTAVTGVPAVVAGLGAGLDRSTFTNMAEAREAAYESGIIPTQRTLAADVRWQLLPDFERDPFKWLFGFDLSHVRVLQEDLYRSTQRHDLAVRGGWEMVKEARKAANLEVDEQRDSVFLRPANVNVMHADLIALPARPPAAAPANNGGSGNGSGNGGGALGLAEVAAIVETAVDRALERERLLST
jgi:HK97 family phage portal protein